MYPPASPCLAPWPHCRAPHAFAELHQAPLDAAVPLARIVSILLGAGFLLALLSIAAKQPDRPAPSTHSPHVPFVGPLRATH